MAININILLPADRMKPGVLTFETKGGNVFEYPVRGKADNRNAIRNRNPNRDPTRPWGDTPTGIYETTQLVRFDERHPVLGDAWIPLEGASGDALTARRNNRTGLGIHAGRGEKLMATYGCVRMRQSDFDELMQLVDDAFLDIEIQEWIP